MPSSTQKRLIEEGDFDALEALWLERLADDARDIEPFARGARLLAEAGEEARTKLLLHLLDDHLQESGRWPQRLELLRQAGELLHAPAELHAQILASLRSIHHDSPSLEILVEFVGLSRAVEDIPKTWEKVHRLQELARLDVGAIVEMSGKGAGRVVEVNVELQSIKVDFDRHAGLRVGFRAAPKMLRPLPADHILRRKLERPEELLALKSTHPGELLTAALASFEAPATAAEIRLCLEGIVDNGEWSSWWAAARKHPQVVVAGRGGRQTYRAAASDTEADAAIRRSFDRAQGLEKVEVFRRNSGRSAELRREMAAELKRLAEASVESDPAQALAVWVALDRVGEVDDRPAWSPERLLESAEGPLELIRAIDDRGVRLLALQTVRRCRKDWSELFEQALDREDDPRILTYLATELHGETPGRLQAFVDAVLSRPRSHAAAFLWLFEQLDLEPWASPGNPLGLLQQALDAARHPEFASHRPRLRRLLGPDGPGFRLLAALGEQQAAAAETALRAASLEEGSKMPLIEALQLRFPALRKQVESPLYALDESISARRGELAELMKTELPAARRAVEEARALGDLRENFEYKAARQRVEYLSARIEALRRDLARARPFDPGRNDTTEARVGTRLALESPDGDRQALTILGPWESQPDSGVISYESELGRSALGKRVGDSLEIDGRAFRLIAIEPYSG